MESQLIYNRIRFLNSVGLKIPVGLGIKWGEDKSGLFAKNVFNLGHVISSLCFILLLVSPWTGGIHFDLRILFLSFFLIQGSDFNLRGKGGTKCPPPKKVHILSDLIQYGGTKGACSFTLQIKPEGGAIATR